MIDRGLKVMAAALAIRTVVRIMTLDEKSLAFVDKIDSVSCQF